MKKIISLLLAMLLVFSLAATAFAAQTVQNNTNGNVDTSGAIIIAGANANYTYKIYKLLHLDTYSNDNGAYTYKVEDAWKDFFQMSTVKDTYVTIDGSGYVAWVENADPVAFAKLALSYAKGELVIGKTVEALTDSNADNFVIADGAGTFSGLTLGYYLVDTSMGALCGLSTTKPTANISVKNGVPTVSKTVKEDSNAGTGTNEFGTENSADIGQPVDFDITITVQAGAEHYVFFDKLPEGMSLKLYGETNPTHNITVKYHDPSITDASLSTKTLIENTDYTLEVKNSTDYTFKITFDQAFLDQTHANDKIYVTYTGYLNNHAVIGGAGNINTAWMTYGDDHTSNVSTTTTHTYGFEIYKTDASMKPLTGAEFQLYTNSEATGSPVNVVYNTVKKTYRRFEAKLLENEEFCGNTIVVTNPNGLVRIDGLDNGTYYLKETKAPLGYKEMVGTKSFIISGDNLYAIVTKGPDNKDIVAVGASVHVENNTGATLPETGAMGTTMFILFGMFVMLGTGVLLVTKKRMSMIED